MGDRRFALGVLASKRGRSAEHVRIGPLSIFALVVIICLSVLAVLVASTAHATYAMSQRQASSVAEQYDAELAAQEFAAEVADVLAWERDVLDDFSESAASASGPGGTAVSEQALAMLESALPSLVEHAEQVSGEQASVKARLEGDTVAADFTCPGGRVLSVRMAVLPDATLRIDEWKLFAVQGEEQPEGNLLVIG
jgi:hypothetical protein